MEAAAPHQWSYNGATDNGSVVPNCINEPPVPAGCAFLSMSYPSTYHATADASKHARLDVAEIQVPATCYKGVWMHHCFAGHCTRQVTPTPKAGKRGVLGRKWLEYTRVECFAPFALAFIRFWGHKQTFERPFPVAYHRLTFAVALLWQSVMDNGNVVLLAFALALLSGARCSATWRARLLTLTAYLYLVPMHISWPTHALAVFSALAWPWFAPLHPDRQWRCRLTLHWAFAVGHLLIHSARQILHHVAFMMGCLLPG
jgi:hypothetical protein